MASGRVSDGAVQGQVDSMIEDAITRTRSQLPRGENLTRCGECDAVISEARHRAIPDVRLCVDYQVERDREQAKFSGHNRRDSKDGQLC